MGKVQNAFNKLIQQNLYHIAIRSDPKYPHSTRTYKRKPAAFTGMKNTGIMFAILYIPSFTIKCILVH